MSVITNRGKDAKESANKKKIDFKKAFIKLKDGESVRVRVPSAEEYVEYVAHGDFGLGVFTQPCIAPTGEACAHCEAADAGIEEFAKLYGKKRYLFALFDIDEQLVRVFDASKNQAKNLISSIEEYADSLDELAFTLKRTGDGTGTTYPLSPIIKLKPADREKFDAFDGEIPADLYDTVLMPRTRTQQIEELAKAGFPVADVFGVTGAKDDEVTPVDDNPTNNF